MKQSTIKELLIFDHNISDDDAETISMCVMANPSLFEIRVGDMSRIGWSYNKTAIAKLEFYGIHVRILDKLFIKTKVEENKFGKIKSSPKTNEIQFGSTASEIVLPDSLVISIPDTCTSSYSSYSGIVRLVIVVGTVLRVTVQVVFSEPV